MSFFLTFPAPCSLPFCLRTLKVAEPIGALLDGYAAGAGGARAPAVSSALCRGIRRGVRNTFIAWNPESETAGPIREAARAGAASLEPAGKKISHLESAIRPRPKQQSQPDERPFSSVCFPETLRGEGRCGDQRRLARAWALPTGSAFGEADRQHCHPPALRDLARDDFRQSYISVPEPSRAGVGPLRKRGSKGGGSFLGVLQAPKHAGAGVLEDNF